MLFKCRCFCEGLNAGSQTLPAHLLHSQVAQDDVESVLKELQVNLNTKKAAVIKLYPSSCILSQKHTSNPAASPIVHRDSMTKQMGTCMPLAGGP